MMLAIENPATGALEVAMLLDEPPSRQFMPGGMGGHPYRRNGPLANAFRDAEMYGYAWLTLVYRGDEVHTWGSKRIKVVSGGRLYSPIRTRLGNETGDLKELRFETICPSLYSPMYGRQTSISYKVIREAEMTLDPDLETDLGEKHELLGYPENRDANAPSDVSELGKYIHADLGCRIVWENHLDYGETWFLQDDSGFAEYRFELTEHQRRRFVREVLKRLGWIREPVKSHQEMEEIARRQCRGHMLNVAHAMNAMASLVSSMPVGDVTEVPLSEPVHEPKLLSQSTVLDVPDQEQEEVPEVREVVVAEGTVPNAEEHYQSQERTVTMEEEAAALAAAQIYNDDEMEDLDEDLDELKSDDMQIVEEEGKRTQSDSDVNSVEGDKEEFVFGEV